ncbi:MAG: PAS domain S-box protein [Desulfobacteraceae bacterium]|nr:MAG: PAS domain S-box protein [Desulfobacteraceae bacterium]
MTKNKPYRKKRLNEAEDLQKDIDVREKRIHWRRKADEEIRLNISRLESLVKIFERKIESVTGFLDYALDEAIRLTESSIGYIYYYDEERKEFILKKWSKDVMDQCNIAEPRTCYELDKTGIWGEAVRQRREIIVNDFQAAHPLKKGYPEGHVKLYKYLTVPVFSGDRIVAVIGVANKAGDYDKTDVLQLTLLMDAVWKVVEQRRMEKDLRDKETFLGTVINAITSPFAVINADDYTVEIANPAYGGITAVGRKCHAISHHLENPCAEAGCLCPLNEIKRTGKPVTVEHTHLNKQGLKQHIEINAYPLYDDNGKLYRIIEYSVDVTERKNAEERIKTSEIRYRRLFETAQDGIIILDAETGQIMDVNPFLMEMVGYSHEEMLGKKIWEIGAFKDVEASKATFRKLQRNGYVRYSDLPVETKDSRSIYVEFVSNLYLVDHKKVIQCNVRDITELKLTSEALQKTNDELEKRIEERTAELKKAVGQMEQEIEERSQAEKSLSKALSEIKNLKDQFEAENIYLRQEIKMKHQFGNIIGKSDGIKYVLYRAEQVAPTNTTVLVLGETGTGKELIAGAIHNMSPRKDRPMLTVNCAALPANLIESELFGREKGAFTGADTLQIGRFEAANGSTLCLDEIGELPLEMQAKLLRAIQHSEFERLGSSRTIKVDVRIIATTNRNLEEAVRKGWFRQDLYYRLNVFSITVPPLRQRQADIPLLVESFIERYSRKLGKQITSINKETMKTLQEYPWPGNVRELESVIEKAAILSRGPVLHLTDKLEIALPPSSSNAKTLEETERNQIIKILSETSWRIEGRNGAADILGLHPSTLRARMHKLGIRRPG